MQDNEGRVMQFFVPMIPPTCTAQMHKVRVRNGKPVFYDPPEVAGMKVKLMSHLGTHRPTEPFGKPIRLMVKWIWPGTEYLVWKTTKPDTDNLQKGLKDIMTKLGFWVDDAHVVSEICEKFTGPVPGIYIEIRELGGEDGR